MKNLNNYIEKYFEENESESADIIEYGFDDAVNLSEKIKKYVDKHSIKCNEEIKELEGLISDSYGLEQLGYKVMKLILETVK